MSEYRTASVHISDLIAAPLTVIKYISDTLQQSCAVPNSMQKAIGIKFNNRTLPQSGVQFRELQPQLTNVENVLTISEGTMVAESMEFINASKLVGSKFCVSYENGEELCKAIENVLHGGKKAYVSFRDASEISSAFLESAIGNLYQGGFTKEELKEKLFIRDLSEDDKFLLKMVIDRVEDFYDNPDRIEAIIDEVLGEYDG